MMNTESEIRSLQTEFQRLGRIYSKHKLTHFNLTSLPEYDRRISMIDRMATIGWSLRWKISITLRRLETYANSLKEEMKTFENREHNLKRYTKKFMDAASIRGDNAKFSFYFQTNSSAYFHENPDIKSIHASGFRFLSCIKRPVLWSEKDCRLLCRSIRDLVLLKAVVELEEAEISNTDSQSLRNMRTQIAQIKDYEKRNADISVYTSFVNEEFNWNLIGKYVLNRHSASECKQAWDLVIRHKKPFVETELIMLRYVVQKNNFQNWEKINNEMIVPKSGYIFFVKYFSLHRKSMAFIRDYFYEESYPKGTHETAFGKVLVDAKRMCHMVNRAPSSKKGRNLTTKEKFMVVKYLKKGYCVSTICKKLPGTLTASQIRNQMNIHRKNSVRNRWTLNETKILLKSVEYLGLNPWEKVSYLLHRNSAQCSNKYHCLMKSKPKSKPQKVNKTPKQVFNELKRFVRKSKIAKSKKFLFEQITKYFSTELEKEKLLFQPLSDDINLSPCVLEILKHMNFDISVSDSISSNLDCWLKRKEMKDETAIGQFIEEFSRALTTLPSDISILPGFTPFTKLASKSTKVLPPNMCTMYGLHALLENQKLFLSQCEGLEDFENLWLRIDQKYRNNQNFIQSKILWYRMLQTLFLWPLKLQNMSPEDSLNS